MPLAKQSASSPSSMFASFSSSPLTVGVDQRAYKYGSPSLRFTAEKPELSGSVTKFVDKMSGASTAFVVGSGSSPTCSARVLNASLVSLVIHLSRAGLSRSPQLARKHKTHCVLAVGRLKLIVGRFSPECHNRRMQRSGRRRYNSGFLCVHGLLPA